MSLSFDNNKAVEIYTEKTALFPSEEKIFNQYLSKPCYILDLGCGTGRTTRHLVDMGHRVLGTDISPMMIEQAKELHPDICFRVEDAQKLRYNNEPFDAIVFSFNGLDYIFPEEARVSTLHEIYRALKPGGIFIFSSHDKDAAKGGTKRNWRRRPRHYKGRYFKERTVYSDLLVYYGEESINLDALSSVGFRDSKCYDNNGKGWRYYVARKDELQ